MTFTVGDIGAFAPPGTPPNWFTTLLAVSDVTPLTYYALDSAIHVVTDAAAISRAISDAANALPAGACVVFQEFGQPSGYNNASSTDGGSDAKQAAFFTAFHGALATVNATRPVRAASLYQMVDMDASDCEGLSRYYNISDPAFIEYLCTLVSHFPLLSPFFYTIFSPHHPLIYPNRAS